MEREYEYVQKGFLYFLHSSSYRNGFKKTSTVWCCVSCVLFTHRHNLAPCWSDQQKKRKKLFLLISTGWVNSWTLWTSVKEKCLHSQLRLVYRDDCTGVCLNHFMHRVLGQDGDQNQIKMLVKFFLYLSFKIVLSESTSSLRKMWNSYSFKLCT